MRTSCICAGLMALLGLAGNLHAADAPRKYALLVGVGQYVNHPPLPGAARDVDLMSTVLQGKFDFAQGDIVTLKNDQATREAILRELKAMAARARTGDIVVVYFSGYGAQLPDDEQKELDGLDETLVPYDAAADGAGELREEELDTYLKEIVAHTERVTAILDSCYSSYAQRGGAAARCLARYPSSRPQPMVKRAVAATSANREAPRSKYTLLQASSRGEIANETVLGTGPHGAFTYELANVLTTVRGVLTFTQVFNEVRMRVSSRFPTQGPVMETPAPTAPFLYDASARPEFAGNRNPADDSPVAEATPSQSARVSVWLEASAQSLARLLYSDQQVQLVSKQQDAELLVVRRDDGFAVLSGDTTPLDFGLKSGAEVQRAVRERARWFALLKLANPSSKLSAHVSLRRDGQKDLLEGLVRPGEVLAYTVSNSSQQPIFANVLVLSSHGGVGVLLLDEQVPAGQSITKRIGTFLPDGRRAVTDHVKLVATSSPLKLPRQADAAGYLTRELLGTSDWTTDQASYELRRQVTRLSSFAVHLDRGQRGKGFEPFGRESVCRPETKGDCITGQPITGDGSLILVDRSFARSELGDMRAGEAFQEAYELQRQTGATRVEPLFDVALGEDLPGLEGRSGNSEKHDQAAEADKQWSLKYVKAFEAWATLRARRHQPAGREAFGVRIAHLDTGYRTHPEFMYTDGSYTTLLPADGLDLVDGGDPYDTLSTSGAMPNPGHGTASGSVIVSPIDCQLAKGSKPCVTGVALGAQLIPIRVHTSVVVLNQRRMAEALFSVVENRIKGQPRIISIAMGGPPSWSVWRAVRAAERAGILIIAAGGNNVGFVVWPARFESTIAVGAINVRCKPWSGSSEGSRIDISAPGESVWRAQVDRDRQIDVIGMGSGTTFATATTSGAAALWVAQHQDSAEFRQLISSGGVTRAFREAVRASSWRPVAGDTGRPAGTHCEDNVGWNASRNGAGIVNAARLLEEPLTLPAERANRSVTLADLPLFASLYPDDTDLDRVTRDYSAIFPPGAGTDNGVFEAEVMYHYTTNDVVRGTIDRVVQGSPQARDYERVRAALRHADLSDDLRRRLQ